MVAHLLQLALHIRNQFGVCALHLDARGSAFPNPANNLDSIPIQIRLESFRATIPHTNDNLRVSDNNMKS